MSHGLLSLSLLSLPPSSSLELLLTRPALTPPFSSLLSLCRSLARLVLSLPLRSFSVGNIIKYSFFSLSSTADAKDVEAFFADKDTTAFGQPLSQGLDSVRSKAAWLERDAGDVEAWLKTKQFL